MTPTQSSQVIEDAAQAFRAVYEADSTKVRELLSLLEQVEVPAAEAVLLLADLEIHRRELMRLVSAGAQKLKADAEATRTERAA